MVISWVPVHIGVAARALDQHDLQGEVVLASRQVLGPDADDEPSVSPWPRSLGARLVRAWCGAAAEGGGGAREGPALVASRRGSRAVSSAGERFPDTEEVTSSNLVRPTTFFEIVSSGESRSESQPPAALPCCCWSEGRRLRSSQWKLSA
jgi:hypothetical protein